MKELMRTHAVGYALAVKEALNAAGIEAALVDENQPGYMSFAGRVRVAVPESEYERARKVLHDMEDAPPDPAIAASWKRQKRGVIIGAVGFGMLTVGGGLTGEGPGGLHVATLAISFLVMATGLTLIVRGAGKRSW